MYHHGQYTIQQDTYLDYTLYNKEKELTCTNKKKEKEKRFTNKNIINKGGGFYKKKQTNIAYI